MPPVWNEELLSVGGYLARAAYEREMEIIDTLWKADEDSQSKGVEPSVAGSDTKTQLRDRALHALKFYTFHTSTPSPRVAIFLEEAFFTCNLQPTFGFLGQQRAAHHLPIISTMGVRGVADVRIPNAAFAEFLKQIPVLPDEVISGAPGMVETLKNRAMIEEITFRDVLQELRARPLQEVRNLCAPISTGSNECN